MNVRQILKAILFTPGAKNRWGLPCIFEGSPGTGKTNVIEQTGARFGLHVEVIIGSIREPTDVGGLARLEDDRFRLVPAGWAADMAEKRPHALLFLDELNTNVPAMQAAMLRLATDGAVGELLLPATVRLLAAQNRTDEASGGWDLTPPLANRFGHLKWEAPSVTDWATWLLGGTSDEDTKPEKAADIEASVLKRFDEPFAKAKGLVTGFLKAQPSLLHKMPVIGSPEAGRAWPSPRTWEMATRAMAGAEVHGLEQSDAEELLSAFVGIGPAAELIQYQRKADLPDPTDVLDEKVKFKHDPKRLDRTTAVLSACAAIIAPDKAPKRKERSEVLWRIINDISKDNADLCVQAAMVLAKRGFFTAPEAHAALARLHPILAVAGFVAAKD